MTNEAKQRLDANQTGIFSNLFDGKKIHILAAKYDKGVGREITVVLLLKISLVWADSASWWVVAWPKRAIVNGMKAWPFFQRLHLLKGFTR